MKNKKINIIWFKRDLRESDHLPLYNAIQSKNPILPVYIYEPEVEYNYDFAYRHWAFVHQSIKAMKIDIQELYGNAYKVFEYLISKYDIKSIYSHEETGNAVTYKRDLDLKVLFKNENIPWLEYPSNGVIRGASNRKNWDKNWINIMLSPIKDLLIKQECISDTNDFSLSLDQKQLLETPLHFKPGEINAKSLLNDFLTFKVENYLSNISYPEKSKYYSSLLSPYISWGNISIRQIYQECNKRKGVISNKKSLSQYMARLKWHCHFIQNLETNPDIEFSNLNSSYDNIRVKKNKNYIKAWKNGKTGYPLIDAAMICLMKTGHLNFRLRSTLVSFLTHHLWQPWQVGSGYLARLFIDYEPGIHFSQFQMQAGTIGIHTIRVYNPVKQSKEKDPDAVFIKKWLPQLSSLPVKLAHEPWKMTQMEEVLYDFNLKKDYTQRIIDHELTATQAREKLWQLKSQTNTIKKSKKILKKHVRKKY